jgi:succinate-semialdehyde dehydrogenase/glutarate-semialdehyde dehydrogenase
VTEVLQARNPRTGELDWQGRPTTPEELGRIVAEARRHQQAWTTLGLQGRSAALGAWAEAIERHRSELEAALIADTGRRRESVMEIDGVLAMIAQARALGERALLPSPPRRSRTAEGVEIVSELEPLGVVGVLSPWNFPLLLGLIDVVPALVAGAVVVAKPSEVTPRFTEPLAKTVQAVEELRGSLSIVLGGAELGSALCELADAVALTGSVATGRAVAAQAARRLIPCFLELGGKDPAVVLAGADLDRAAAAILFGATSNAGQACQSIERVYVERQVAGALLERLVGLAERLGIDWPDPEAGGIGPIIAERQAAVLAAHLDDAFAKGARALTGGRLEHHGGTWLRPTVLVDVDHTMAVMREETFGPIIPVMATDGVEEAITLANDSDYGLSAAVFAPDKATGLAVGRRLRAGAVSINDAALTAIVYDAEKQAAGCSGLGPPRFGELGLRRFVRARTSLVADAGRPDPWWPPAIVDPGRPPRT